MKTNFERFLAGEDALARLIREQSAFNPDEAQEERLLAALSELPQASQQDFAPPATLEAAFLQEMHAVQQAQAPRRDALLARLQSGEHADDVLNHPISAATQAWLAELQPAAPVSRPQISARASRRWWELGGLVFTGAVLAAIGMQIYFPNNQVQQASIAVNEHTPAQVDSSSVLQLAEQTAKTTVPLYEAPKPESANRQPRSPTPGAAHSADTPVQAEAADRVAGTSGNPNTLALAELSKGIMLERSLPQTKGMPELDMSVVESVKSRMPESAAPAVPEVVAELAPAPKSRLISLNESPSDIARVLSPEWGGQTLVLYAADPQSAQVQNWVEQLRSALPPDTRLTLQPAVDLDAQMLRLVSP